MKFELQAQWFQTKVWAPDDGVIGQTVVVDTETTLIVTGEIPKFVLGSAFAGNSFVYLLTTKNLGTFCTTHANSNLVMHNAPFDISVITQQVGFDFDAQVRRQLLWDTGLMFQLHELAVTGIVPEKWSLATLAKKFLGLDLDKDDSVRSTFGQFLKGDVVDYDAIPEKHLQYAAIDAIVTYKIYENLAAKIKKIDSTYHLSHKLQLMGAIGLDAVSRLGIGFDQKQREVCLKKIDAEISLSLKALNEAGCTPGTAGVQKQFEKIVSSQGCNLPRTSTGRMSQATDALEEFRETVPFIDTFLRHREYAKLRTFIAKLEGNRIRTRFVTLKSTGRTSSREPNLQNLPRADGIRDCFIPAPGFKFLIIDYSTLELCTLAQVCYNKYEFSKMRELINEGSDLHTWFASIITGKTPADVSKADRQAAKAANFGFPGGLGIKSFIVYAKKTYGVDLDEARAIELKDKWLNTFPEMRSYLADTLLTRHDFTSLVWCDNPEIAASIFKRILKGEILSKADKPYSQSTLDWAFKTVLADVAPDFVGITAGSPEILNQVLRESVTTRTGRKRGNVTYCQARNTPFQGLAADGAKIAIYRLVRASFRVVNFIHDEFIVEVPECTDYREVGNSIEKIIVEAMTAVVPDVAIRADWVVTDRWYKGAKKIETANGSVGVFTTTENPQIITDSS